MIRAMQPVKYMFWIVVFGVGVLSACLSAEEPIYSSMRVRLSESPQQLHWQQPSYGTSSLENAAVAVRKPSRSVYRPSNGTSFSAMSQQVLDENRSRTLVMN